MRRSKVLAKLRAGQVARLCSSGSFLPYFSRFAAAAGYDGIWVDGEHKAFTAREVQALLAFHHLADIDCLWRPPTREKNALYRILEDGASGLIIPHVESAVAARDLVQSVRFPPLGNRGLDGAGLDGDFGYSAGPDFPSESNRETILFVQVESPAALDQIEEIAAVEGVDGIFLGPGDLALRLGCKPGATDPTMLEVHRKVATATARNNKVWGRPVLSEEEIPLVVQAGARFIVYGAEYRMMRSGLNEHGKALDRLLASPVPESI